MSDRILAIDPGPKHSAWLVLAAGRPWMWDIDPSDSLLEFLRRGWFRTGGTDGAGSTDVGTVVIEQVESFGMAVGREVFETVRWAGRFEEAARPLSVVLVPRRTVKLYLCNSAKAKDANIRRALIDRFGGPAATRKGGPLHGISRDVWSALGLAVTYADGALNVASRE